MSVVTYPPFWTASRSHPQTSSSPTAWSLHMGPISWPETPLNDYQHPRWKPQIEDNHVCSCRLGNDVRVFSWSSPYQTLYSYFPSVIACHHANERLNKFFAWRPCCYFTFYKNSYTDRRCTFCKALFTYVITGTSTRRRYCRSNQTGSRVRHIDIIDCWKFKTKKTVQWPTVS